LNPLSDPGVTVGLVNKKERSYVAQLTYIVHGFPEKLQLVLGHGLNLHTREARTLEEKCYQ